jgi:hypothetical protein
LFPARNVPRYLYSLCLAVFLSTPALSIAQVADPAPADTTQIERYDELVRWLAEYKRWEAWSLKWANRVAYNAAGGMVKKRPARPEPPAWLADDCAQSLTIDGALGEACRILARWDDLPQMLLDRRSVAGVQANEASPKSSFLQRVHLTGGWVPAQLPAPKVYLAAGMQIGIVEVGRATLPAVGVGLMAVADGSGGYDWKPATVIGIGYRLASFGFPWVKREANLHLNIARATIHGANALPIGFDPSQNLVGFSLTFAKR